MQNNDMTTAIEQNVQASQAADEALQLVIDYGKELELSPDATAHYWQCLSTLVNGIRCGNVKEDDNHEDHRKPDIAAEWSTDTSDEPCMPDTCKNYGGQLCSEVNPTYFEWLAEQDWIERSERWADVADWMRTEGYL